MEILEGLYIFCGFFNDGIYKMINHGKTGEFYQFSTPEHISIKKLVKKIYKNLVCLNKFIINVADRPGKDKNYKIYDKDAKIKLGQ